MSHELISIIIWCQWHIYLDNTSKGVHDFLKLSPYCPCVLCMLVKAFGPPPTSHDAHQSSTIILIFIAKCSYFHYMGIVHWRVACPNFLFQHFFVFSKYPCVQTPEGIINCYLIINAINGTICPFLLLNIWFLEIDM